MAVTPQPLAVTESQCQNAITAADATRIAKSTVFLTVLTPNERVAADVTTNGTISSFDASYVASRAVAATCATYPFPVTTLTGSDWVWVPASLNFTPLTGDVSSIFVGILYGDVTENWSATFAGSAPGEAPSVGTDSATVGTITGNAGSAVAISQNATMYLASNPVQQADGSWQVVLGMANSDGIVGLDMLLGYDPAVIRITGVAPTGLSSGLAAVQNDLGVEYAVGLFGTAPMQGTGQFLVVTYVQRQAVSGLPFTVSAVANEGLVPVTFSPAVPGGPRMPKITVGE